jgi:hypothetical protein
MKWFGMVLLVSGCATESWSYTASATAPAREATCDFAVVSTPPGPGYQEIGLLDDAPGGPCVRGAQAFKQAVRSEVCKAGGEVVMTEISGFGCYKRGTTFRKSQ